MGSAFSKALYDSVLEIVGHHLGYSEPDEAEEAAERELNEALPCIVRLDWPRKRIVMSAVAALHRYKYNGSSAWEAIRRELEDSARWHDRHDNMLAGPPNWVVEEVAEVLQLRAARRIAINALDQACLSFNKDALTAGELLDLEPEAMAALAAILEHKGEFSAKALGYVLRRLSRKPGETEPGIVPGKFIGGHRRWTISR